MFQLNFWVYVSELMTNINMKRGDEEKCPQSQEETNMEAAESVRANSECTLITANSRSSLPAIVAWWRNYHKDAPAKVQSDEDGIYQSIKQRHSPPADEIELSSSNENVESPSYPVKISRHTLRKKILEFMKSINSGNLHYLEEIENGKMTVESSEQIFSTSSMIEKNITFFWAALNNRVDLLESLYKCGVDVHFSEPTEGFTALHLGAFSDSVDCTMFLISHGADVNFISHKYTPLETACFHNSFKVAKLLLENGAAVHVTRKFQNKEHTSYGTPLHSAVKANAIECVQLLLAEGAEINPEESIGISPLHIAAEMGYLQCMNILLDSGCDPNLTTADTRNSALHLAADGGFSECISLLLHKGANADARNHKGQTPLHLAAHAHSVECVETLLSKGGCDPNSEDHEKRTPLHSAVGRALNSCEITELLIKYGACVNGGDVFGYTPLHVAALNENTQLVQILINNGADVSVKTKGGNSALGILVRKTPLALPTLYRKLDTAILMHDPEVSSSKEVIMKLDFRIFLQRCHKGEMTFLKTFIDEGQKEILEHPLCQAFLHIKWEKIRKYYIARLMLYGVLVLCLTSYVLTALYHNCKENIYRNSTWCQNSSTFPVSIQNTPVEMKIEWYLLTFFTICEAVRKICACVGCSSLKRYLCHVDNIIEWFVLISNILLSYLFINENYNWQSHVAAFAVLFAWVNVMLLLGQLPVLGSYIAMYIKVQKEFLKLFIAYACLLIGFTLSFCVIFPAKSYFQYPTYSFIQVTALMIGSVEYNDLIFENKTSEFMLETSAHIMFLIFMLFVTIIMMNLLVGIAVRDIQGLQKTAGLSKLVRQTKLIYGIELSLLNSWLPNYILMLVRRTALVSPSGYRVVLHVKPLNHQENRLPKDVLKDAYELAKSRKCGTNLPSLKPQVLSSIGSEQNSPSQLLPEASTQIKKLQTEVEKGNKAIANLKEEIQELKSMLRGMK
jgi:ankyrin repeat protein